MTLHKLRCIIIAEVHVLVVTACVFTTLYLYVSCGSCNPPKVVIRTSSKSIDHGVFLRGSTAHVCSEHAWESTAHVCSEVHEVVISNGFPFQFYGCCKLIKWKNNNTEKTRLLVHSRYIGKIEINHNKAAILYIIQKRVNLIYYTLCKSAQCFYYVIIIRQQSLQ